MIIERSKAILLGNFIGMQEVAYYDLANKIVRLGSFPIMILNQVLYPKVASERNFRLMRKVMAIIFLGCYTDMGAVCAAGTLGS